MMNRSVSPQEAARRLVGSLWAAPDDESVRSFIVGVAKARADDPEMFVATCEEFSARIKQMKSMGSPLDLNAAVIDPRFPVGDAEMVLIQGKIGRAAVDCLPELRLALTAGDQVALQAVEDRVVIVQRIGRFPATGIKRIESVLPEGQLVVTDRTGEKRVLTMAQPLRDYPELTTGMEVFCAEEVGLALGVDGSGPELRSEQLLEEIPDLTLDDLGGQPGARRQLQQILALITTSPRDLAAFGLARQQLILFEGSPGTGKTYSALIVASMLRKKGIKVAVLMVKGPEFLTPLVGASEAAVRGLIERAGRLARDYDLVYIVWDEFEALFHARGKRFSSTIVEDTLVPTLLAEIDGLGKAALHNVFLVAISNRPDLLDSAITREGRLGQRVRFTNLQTESAVEQVARIHLRGLPLADGLTLSAAAERMAAFSFCGRDGDGLAVGRVRMSDGRREIITSRQVLTGAIIKGSIDRAAQSAFWRWHKGGSRGVRLNDLFSGLERAVTALPLSVDNLAEYLGWPLDECARVVEVERLNVR